MRVRYSYSSRKTGRARDPKNARKQKKRFPEFVSEIILNSDILIQVLDSRFIKDTRNKDLESYIKTSEKSIINVLNKADLIDVKKIKKKSLEEIYPYVFVSCIKREGIKQLRDRIKIESKRIKNPIDPRGKITIGIIGYPNTGKSSLINLLAGRSLAGTAAEAGFTKGVKKIRLTPDIMIVDSPGVIPKEKYSSHDKDLITTHAKLSGRSYSQVKEPDIIISNLMKEYPGLFESYYNIKSKGDSENLIEKLGEKKGFLKKGGLIDYDRAARSILRDWQEGKIKPKYSFLLSL